MEDNQKDLITWWQFWKGRLALVPRLPIIAKTAKHIAKLGVENQESWGSMLEDSG